MPESSILIWTDQEFSRSGGAMSGAVHVGGNHVGANLLGVLGVLGAALLASFSLACAATTVDVKIDQRKDLAGFCTWNFLPLESGNVRGPYTRTRPISNWMERLLERGLLDRGFSRVTGRPDFYVTYLLDVRRQLVIIEETPAMQHVASLDQSPSYDVQATVRRSELHETGMLTLFVSDPDEQAVVWRGGYEGRFRGQVLPHLEEAVTSLLDRLAAPAAAGEAASSETPKAPADVERCAGSDPAPPDPAALAPAPAFARAGASSPDRSGS
jgi:hypothetical protein